MAKLSLNNVTVAEEINGVAHLAGGMTIPESTTFPTGHIIQIVETTPYTSATVNTTTPTNIAGGNITILENSKIFALSTGNGNPASAGDWNYVGLFLDGTSIGQQIIFQTAAGSYNHAWAVQAVSSNLSAGTYTVNTKAWNGTGTMNYREVGTIAPALFLFEIAG